jgi:hypothetical protein
VGLKAPRRFGTRELPKSRAAKAPKDESAAKIIKKFAPKKKDTK